MDIYLLIVGSYLIGSVPFIYQVHGAPNDYLRFTKNYLINEFKKEKFKAIYVKELGYGPFLAAFSILFPLLYRPWLTGESICIPLLWRLLWLLLMYYGRHFNDVFL